VVPADDIARGATLVELARRTGRPVLVSRPPKTRCTLLVVTDAAADNYASLARAARLSQAFHAPVLAFHNVHVSSTAPFVPVVDALARPWKQIQADAAGAHPEYHLPELDVLLAYGRDPVDAVLQQARREDADMIIIGVRDEASGKEASDELAAGVIDRAVRSVLVVPDAAAVSLAAESTLPDEHASTTTSVGAGGCQQRGVVGSRLDAVESTRVAEA
jgi:nucleotide-binding universal stress UspA family protein